MSAPCTWSAVTSDDGPKCDGVLRRPPDERLIRRRRGRALRFSPPAIIDTMRRCLHSTMAANQRVSGGCSRGVRRIPQRLERQRRPDHHDRRSSSAAACSATCAPSAQVHATLLLLLLLLLR